MELVMSQTLGTVFYSVVMLVVGALVVGPAWNWVNAKFPWNKK
jgi:hypothetical protein